MHGCAVKKMVIVSLVDFFIVKMLFHVHIQNKEIFIYNDVVDCN